MTLTAESFFLPRDARRSVVTRYRCARCVCGFVSRSITSNARCHAKRDHAKRCNVVDWHDYTEPMTPEEVHFVKRHGYGPRWNMTGNYAWRCVRCDVTKRHTTPSNRSDAITAHLRNFGCVDSMVRKWRFDRVSA